MNLIHNAVVKCILFVGLLMLFIAKNCLSSPTVRSEFVAALQLLQKGIKMTAKGEKSTNMVDVFFWN